MRNYATSEANGTIDLPICQAALKMAEVDKEGLDKQDRRYLDVLTGVFGGGPAGVEALAATLSLAADTLSDDGTLESKGRRLIEAANKALVAAVSSLKGGPKDDAAKPSSETASGKAAQVSKSKSGTNVK